MHALRMLNTQPPAKQGEIFMGSGTTLIAAETTGRVCFGIELNPAYVDVAIERWQSFTGANAVLSETGETLVDMKAKRLAAERAPFAQTEYWPLAQLKPYARNAKTHDANQVAKTAASMAEPGRTGAKGSSTTAS